MSVRIGLGLGTVPLEDAAGFFEFVDQAEALGFDSIWLSDRLLTTAPALEPLTALSMVTARTRRMKVGTSVLVLPLRNPVVLAKEIATIDFLSEGRMLPAFGIGLDDPREYEAAGTRFEERVGRTHEAVTVLRRLWSEEHVTHHGKYFELNDVTIAPRPAQRRIPIWFGGRSEPGYRRIGRIADGWLASFLTPDEIAHGIERIRFFAAEAGRSIDDDHYGIGLSICVAHSEAAALDLAGPYLRRGRPEVDVRQLSVLGTPGDCIERIGAYLRAGASKFVLRPACPPELLTEQLRIIASDVAPRFDLTMSRA